MLSAELRKLSEVHLYVREALAEVNCKSNDGVPERQVVFDVAKKLREQADTLGPRQAVAKAALRLIQQTASEKRRDCRNIQVD